MKPSILFALLCIPGVVLPFSQFLPWVAEHGIDPARFIGDLFANPIAAFFGLDVVVCAVVMMVWLVVERHRPIKGRWMVVPATFLVGVSLSLPLYLALRAREEGK